MATRAYELSKKLGISNKDLIELLKEHGYTISNIAVVPDDAIALIEKIFSQRASGKKIDLTVETSKLQPQAQKVEPLQKPNVAVKSEKKVETKPVAQETKPAERPQEAVTKSPPPAATPTFAQRPSELAQPPKQPEPVKNGAQIEITLEAMTVADIAQKAHKQVSDIILTLLKQGIVAPKNQLLPEKTIAKLAEIYGLKVAAKQVVKQQEEKPKEVLAEGVWQERLPVVVVIGHVDHGKTTLLDFIRKTRVAAKEKGGITQHLGAYEVKTDQGNVVFLDTPGHEAFSLMRARGIKVADIAILVIAADDGIMPQTIEAIDRAKKAEIPLIVALNKVDKASAVQIETVKRQLAQHDLAPEEWGGQTVVMPISAKFGTGIDKLLEVVVLQAQLMDLKANMTIPARGYVLESKIEKGRGPVATVICQHGILRVGDYFVAGSTGGKVSSLVDSSGKRINEISPSMPALVAGFTDLPQAGDSFDVTTQEASKKGATGYVSEMRPDIYLKKAAGETEITLIVKADNGSSREALVNSLSKLASPHRKITIVTAGVGTINESDVILASDTNSLIYGFHVKALPSAFELAQKKGVIIKTFDIIYKLIEEVEMLLEAGKPIKMVTKKIGEASVLKVFDIKGLGIVAGAHVKTGRFIRDGKVIIWRGKHKVGEGTIKGLQRDRKPVKEVHAGFECAFMVDGFNDWQVDDRVECFVETSENS